jgi:hypothetical protein
VTGRNGVQSHRGMGSYKGEYAHQMRDGSILRNQADRSIPLRHRAPCEAHLRRLSLATAHPNRSPPRPLIVRRSLRPLPRVLNIRSSFPVGLGRD